MESQVTTDSEHEIRRAMSELTRSSWISLALLALGVLTVVGSAYYSATRLAPLEKEIADKRSEVELLNKTAKVEAERVSAARAEYAGLKASIEKLYAVRVTPTNEVYEVKATARATGRQTSYGPQYSFTLWINASVSVLQHIRAVSYTLDDPTIHHKINVSTDPTTQFGFGYVGWGCLDNVGVQIELADGSKHSLEFNMCKSLGPEWS